MLPGSRPMEIDRHLPIFKVTLEHLDREFDDLVAVVPAAPAVAKAVAARVAGWSTPAQVVCGSEAKFNALAAADAALAVSGTIALELALARVPAVITYRANPISAFVIKSLRETDYVSLVNNLVGYELQRELLQDNCRADLLAGAVGDLLRGSGAGQISGAQGLADRLRPEAESPSLCAARVVLQVIDRGAKSG